MNLLFEHMDLFAPIDLNKAQFASIHEANGRIGIENMGQCVRFYRDFLIKSASQIWPAGRCSE